MFWRDFSRFGRPWGSMYNDLLRLQNEMERLFSDVRRPSVAEFPALNVWTDQDGAIVTAEIPGVNRDDIEISVTGSSLTLSGKRQAEEGVSYHRQERTVGKFARTLDLPFQVDAGKVEARLDRGILEIRLPRAEADKPRKIKVKA